jgi:hypothetical protein
LQCSQIRVENGGSEKRVIHEIMIEKLAGKRYRKAAYASVGILISSRSLLSNDSRRGNDKYHRASYQNSQELLLPVWMGCRRIIA